MFANTNHTIIKIHLNTTLNLIDKNQEMCPSRMVNLNFVGEIIIPFLTNKHLRVLKTSLRTTRNCSERVKTCCRLHFYMQHLSSWGPKESRSVAIRFSCSLGISLGDVSKRTWKETLSSRTSPTVSDHYGCQIHFRDSETGKVPHLAKSGGVPPQLESRPRFSAVVGSSIYIYIHLFIYDLMLFEH